MEETRNPSFTTSMTSDPLDTFVALRCKRRLPIVLALICGGGILASPLQVAVSKPRPDEASESAPTAGVGQAARMGTANFIASGTSEATVVASGFIIGKYRATELQRKIAEERARQAYQSMSPDKKKGLKAKKIRYLAVDTQKDGRIKGRKAILIWDTQSQEIVGTQVYDVAVVPPLASRAVFETYAAEYIGEGRRDTVH